MKFKSYSIILTLVLCQLSFLSLAQKGVLLDKDTIPQTAPNNLEIYLVIGQSNMAGRAEIGAENQIPVPRTFLFSGDETNAWVEATNPLNRFSTVRKKIGMQRLGPAYSFAKTMAASQPDQQIGLVVNAKGGTKIVQWLPGTKLYKAAIEQTNKALKYGKLKGVIWHQGEGDSDSLRMSIYLGRLEILVNGIREEFGDPKLPFIAGQLFENEQRKPFNSMLLGLPDFIRNTEVVLSEATNATDGTHFDSESVILLGERYGEKMIIMQGSGH